MAKRSAGKRKAPLAVVNASGAGLVILFQETLEVNLATELQGSPRKRRRELPEARVAETGVHILELRVVPSVEGLNADFESAAARFAEREVLKEGHIPVIATRSTQGVVVEITPSA